VVLAREVSKILAYRQPVDMRKSFDGLLGLVKHVLAEDPLSGTLYVFANRRGTYVKAVYWDRTGFCLFAKRLERGRFVFPNRGETFEMSEQTFRLLLDGIVLGRSRPLL
jgi:transposase